MYGLLGTIIQPTQESIISPGVAELVVTTCIKILIIFSILYLFTKFMGYRNNWTFTQATRMSTLIFSKTIHDVLLENNTIYTNIEMYDNMWSYSKICWCFWIWDYKRFMYNDEMLKYMHNLPVKLLHEILELTYDNLRDSDYMTQFRQRVMLGQYLEVADERHIN